MKSSKELGFGLIDLRGESHVIAPGRYRAQISDVRLVKNPGGDTLWLFISLDVCDSDGVVLGHVEDRFITIAARDGSPHIGRVREGLKRLALYANACSVDLNGCEPREIPVRLVGKDLLVAITRRGVGVQAENCVVGIMRSAA